MAALFISEFVNVAAMNGWPQIAQAPAVAHQNVAIGGASVQSAAFNATTRFVRLHCDVACSVEFGANPTALATICRLAAGQTEYFGVTAGQKVAVIATA